MVDNLLTGQYLFDVYRYVYQAVTGKAGQGGCLMSRVGMWLGVVMHHIH